MSEGFNVFLIKKKNEYEQINQILKKENCLKLVIDSKRKSIKQLTDNVSKNIKIILIDNFFDSKSIDLTVISSVKNPKKNILKIVLLVKNMFYMVLKIYQKIKSKKINLF